MVDLGIEGMEIVAHLGGGGQADVYWAHDLAHQRAVAIKVFKPDSDFSQFDRERKAIGHLSRQANVVYLYSSGHTSDGAPYLVTEYADGGSLLDAHPDWDEGIQYIIEIATALAAAHDKDIVHRDLKPHNVLLFSGSDGSHVAKLADFGIAAVPGATTTTNLRGSTAYAPPELLAQGKKTDERGDIYSLGCTAYFVLTGEHPPPGRVQLEVDRLGPASEIPAIWAAVARAVAYEPDDRYDTAAEFGAALSEARAAALALPLGPGNGIVQPAGTAGETVEVTAPSGDPAVIPSPAGRGPLGLVPFRLDSTRNVVGLGGAVATGGLVVFGVLTSGPPLLLIALAYVASLLIAHALGHD